MGIVGVLGTLACPMCCGIFGLVFAVPGWVAFFMGRGALQQYPSCGLTKTGMILGIVTMVLSALAFVGLIALMAFGILSGGLAQGMPHGMWQGMGGP